MVLLSGGKHAACKKLKGAQILLATDTGSGDHTIDMSVGTIGPNGASCSRSCAQRHRDNVIYRLSASALPSQLTCKCSPTAGTRPLVQRLS
jgi:hypothetical protein